jgi:TetR/AcrR family transcriptional repressor of nem operon
MEHYAQLVAEPLLAALDHDDPRISLARFFEATVARLGDREIPSGCLNTNTSVAVPICPAGVRQALGEQVDQMETAIYQALLRGQQNGYLAPGEDLRALARYVVCIAHGMAVMNRRHVWTAALNDVVKTALTTISTRIIR